MEERERIVAALADHPALILRNHGLLTVGRSAAEMFSNMYYLNRACQIQVDTLGMGLPLQPVDEAVARRVTEQYDRMAFDDDDLTLEWNAHLRLLETLDASYTD